MLDERRIAHVQGCEQTALALSKRWGGNPSAAAAAAVLHDITKKLSTNEQLQLLKKYDIVPDNDLLSAPKLLHAVTGALLAKELLADTKEIAEHVMLIDLARNDIGRIAETGSVKLTEKMAIEKYSHVQHIVSNVEGILKPGLTNLDVLKATFPAGTLSGAPKVRAMEIIDEMEPVKRGIYGGACGYLSFSGEMDLAIAIRTGLIYKDMLYIGAGAGIVADSNPESEYQETENKARAVIRAAEMVQDGSYRQPRSP